MNEFLNLLTILNDTVNSIVWGPFGLILLLGTGLLMTGLTGVFQLSHLTHWWKKTVGGVFHKDTHNKSEIGAVSQFQALCTALAATIGTGNIAGVAAAITIGGPGAVFWMWVAAFFGMMTNYSENVLGIYFRRKNAENEWCGGPMYYLKEGLGNIIGYERFGSLLAVLFSLFAALAAFGIGNMGQVNKIVKNIESAFFANVNAPVLWSSGSNQITLIALILGIVLMLLGSLIIVGGLQRVAAVAERLVPLMAVLYVIGGLIICIWNGAMIPSAFAAIFRFALGKSAVAGGAAGFALHQVITQGCKRGVFSNEAGLGSSVMVHSNSNVKEPVKQGFWGIFEVFADTMVVCTMTAMVILTSGFINLETGQLAEGLTDATLVAESFKNHFGPAGAWFTAVAMLLFAFTTILGWSHYGSKAVEYLFGLKGVKVYRILFSLLIVSGALLTSSLAWDISDTFNGMMMIPNLIGVIALSPLVVKITRNYIARKINGEAIAPILSNDPAIQKEMEEAVANGAE